MPNFFALAAALAFALFNVAQYQGWSLFADEANAQQLRSADAARRYHK